MRLPIASIAGRKPERSSSGLMTSRISARTCGSASSSAVCGLGVCTSFTSSRLISSYARFFSISFFTVPASISLRNSLLKFRFRARPADAARDDNEYQTNDADNHPERAHRAEIAVDVKMVQQRADRLSAGGVEKNRRAELAEVNRRQDDPARDEAGPEQWQDDAAERRPKSRAASHRRGGQIVVQLNDGARHRAQSIRQKPRDIADEKNP